MRHYFSTRVRIVLVVALVLAAVLAVISGLTGLTIPQMVVKGVLTPLRTGASLLTDQAEQIYSYIFKYESLAAENAQLKEQIASMEDKARQADATARENERLRTLLGLQTEEESYQYVDAYIISWSSNDWTNTITIGKGAKDGITEGMCAVTANREMVGLVVEVGTNYAVIRTVLDSSLKIGATISSSGYNGMVQGNYIDGHRNLLRMDYLPTTAVIRNQDQVVTTGSVYYPRDLLIGHIVDADFDDSGIAKFALLEPAADILTLEQVFILTDYEGNR